ncbi:MULTISPECIES: WD40/YVTN/BNR-like repeat-containing protein [Enterococcus]|uniref:WD40/YVTN/BNR-like repeat-containing protein n=1 Tax=Enterococcus TaxID=1350 RepID=UPI000ED824F1|nr:MULTISPECIES: hypothetical protein [Enterococcus]HCM86399.1 hypothetical protein [Enterococcus sp.]
MDQELLIIELLSAAEPIYRQAQKNRHQNLISAFLYIVAVCVVFFVIGSFAYQHLHGQGGTTDSNYWLHGSAVLGILIAVLAVFLFSINLIQGIVLRRSFQRFLVRCVQKTERYPIIYQDDDSYYLAEQSEKLKIRLLKENCVELLITMDEEKIYLGNQKIFFGFSSLQLFVLVDEPISITLPSSKNSKINRKWVVLIICLFFAGVAGTIAQSRRNQHHLLDGDSPGRTVSTSSSETMLSSDDLLIQQGTAPNRQINQVNQLDFNNETHELYMTTDGGGSWSFVPLKPEWMRTGRYLLTSGEIPMGYWMDKTYNVSPDFSWFIYSEDDVKLYFLASHDNGKTWQKSLVSENVRGIRYRKAQFFANGSGVLVYSNIGSVNSAEGVEVYQTMDYGKTWYPGNRAGVYQPVQNISFIDPMLGFVSTREKIYYTNNGGKTLKVAVVTIPKEYQTGGLDIFQSPNEVTQIGTGQLEAKFYLVKIAGIDQGKMFACLYRSSDNGETWQFAEQLSEVKPTE